MMIVKLRKVRGVPGAGLSSDLYEWQPQGSKRWYFVHILKITIHNGHIGSERYEQNQLLSQVFNAMLMGLEVTVKASYDLNAKKLSLKL